MRKRTVLFCIILLLCSAFCACGSEEPMEETTKWNGSPVDVDLTVLSSDLTFSRVADLLATAEESRGKTVKLSGMFNAYYIESSGHLYLACEMPDLSCSCMQGLEFELGEGASYPEDYPSIGEIITVKGTYDTYERDGSLYGILRDAELE